MAGESQRASLPPCASGTVGGGGSRSDATETREARPVPRRPARTLVRELEPRPVLRVVAVEADERVVRGAEQRRGQVRAAELADQGAAGPGAVLDLQVVVVRFRGEVQEPEVHACERHAECELRAGVSNRRFSEAVNPAPASQTPSLYQAGRSRGGRTPDDKGRRFVLSSAAHALHDPRLRD